MYVTLYPRKQLLKTKQSLLYFGNFLFFGGGYAVVRELWLLEQFRPDWFAASIMLVLAGVLMVAVGADFLRLKDAYFLMNQERISYRLAPLGSERSLLWRDIEGIAVTEYLVIFELKNSRRLKMRLGNIQQPEVALHVSRSLHLAALEKKLRVNGLQLDPKETTVVA